MNEIMNKAKEKVKRKKKNTVFSKYRNIVGCTNKYLLHRATTMML